MWGKIEDIIADQRDRFFLWVPVFIGVGIAGYFSLPFEPVVWAGGSCLLIFSAFGFLARGNSLAVLFFGVFALVALGFSAGQFRTQIVYTPIIDKPIKFADVEGVVDKVEDLGPRGGSRVILTDVRVEDLSPQATPRKIRLKFTKDGDVKVGQRIRTLASLNLPSGPVAPGAFDFRRMAFFQSIGAVGFSYRAPEVVQADIDEFRFLAHLRQHITQQVEAHTRYPFAAIVTTFLTGQRGAISEEDNEAMRDSSLAHMLSISGMHVVMMAGGIFFFLRFLMCLSPYAALHWPVKKISAAAGLMIAGFYVFLVGADVPALRALFMTGLVMVAIMMDRSPFSMRLVAAAAIVLLLWAPESLIGVSFQMSFAAVAAMIAFFEYTRPFWTNLSRRPGLFIKFMTFMMGTLVTSIIAGTATGIFALYHFQNFSVYGVLANMIAMPIMSIVVMPATVFTYLALLFGLEAWPMRAMEWGVSWVLATAHWTAGLDGAVWHMAAWPGAAFGTMVCAMVFAMLWKGRGKMLAAPFFVAALVLILFHRPADIQVSDTAKLMAVRGNDGGLWMSTRRGERFTSDNWMRRSGQEGEPPRVWPKEGAAEGFPFMCDPEGCRGEISGQSVSVARTPAAVREDCSWADVLISPIPVSRECAAGRVIDLFDVKDAGAHGVWVSAAGIVVRTVADEAGDRPWTR